MHSHSHLYHRSATHTTTGNHHLPPPQMLLSACTTTTTTTTTNNHNPPLLFDHYPYHDHQLSDSSPPSRSSSASINHKEAEKRRRERINSHLNRLRTLLPCNSKMDKASLLAKVIERLKELKQTTSEIEQLESLPSERDEITVISLNNNEGDGRIVIKASMCCENRSDLVTDMIQTLKSLQLSPLRMEMVAIGGRIRNIILVESTDCERDDSGELIYCLKEALNCLIKSNLDLNQSSSKRRRMIVCR